MNYMRRGVISAKRVHIEDEEEEEEEYDWAKEEWLFLTLFYCSAFLCSFSHVPIVKRLIGRALKSATARKSGD